MLLIATKGCRQWLVSLICEKPTQASGACHRSLQLVQLLNENGWQLNEIEHPKDPSSRLETVRRGLLGAFRNGPLKPLGLDSLRAQGHVMNLVDQLHQRWPQLDGVLLEGTGYGDLCAVAEWKRRMVRTVLVPANIESLAPNIESWTHQKRDVSERFAHERRWWAMADSIFTISMEETWWLQLHGINAEYLPYYPNQQRKDKLLEVREERQEKTSLDWLWLADFRNPANQSGVPLTLKWLNESRSHPKQLMIAGRGCEWLTKKYGSQLPEYAQVLGEITDHELEEFYKSCGAMLIVHPATSGMLTRVVDAAIAGIPVVGNSMALKSYASYFDEQRVIATPQRSFRAEEFLMKTLNS